uniref:FLYWCH-type domain-containing protein n=1 Tax=Bursaphelenchus xylophilus TaxID=6326 RepID=A0A1I7SI64_BURXY
MTFFSGEGKRSKQQYLPCHCTATIRLNYHSATQVLRITTFRPLHNHELSYEEYTKLTNKRKSTVGPASPLTVQASSASTSGVSSNGTSPAGTVSPIQVSPTEISSPKSGLDIGLAGLPGLTAQTKEILAMASQQKEFSPVSGQIKDTDGPKIATPAKNLAQSGQKISPSPSKPSPSSLSPVQAPQQLPPQLLPEGKLVKKDENSNIYTLQDQKIAADVANQWIQAALAIKMENKQPAPEPVQPAESQNFQSALVQLLLNDPNQLRQLLEAENQRRLEQKRREEELARLRTPNLANLLQLAGFLKQNPQGSSNIPSQDEILRKLMENCAQNGNLGVSSEEEESRSNAEYGLSTGLSQSTAGINLKSGQSQGQQTAPARNQIIHPTQNQPQIAQSAFKQLLSAQQPPATSISGISSLNQPIYPSNFGFSPQIPLNSQNSTTNSTQSASELASTWMKMYSQQIQSQTNGIGHQNLKTNQGEDQEGARQLLNLLQALQPQNGVSQ